MGDSLMRLFPIDWWVAASQKNAPVNPRAPANGIGRKEEAAYQRGLKSAIRGRTTLLRHRGHDRHLGSLIQINWSVLIPFAKERRRKRVRGQ
jgi:hypothetical protein